MASAKKVPTTSPDIQIVGDDVQIHPGVESSRRNETHDQNLVEHMARFRDSPLDFLKEISLYVSGSGWRSYDNIIGQPIFYSGFTDNMKAAVMSNQMLQDKIQELASNRLRVEEQQGLLQNEKKKARRKAEIEQSLHQVADTMTDNMVCKMESKNFIRGAYYLVTQLLTRAYHQGIHVSSEEVLRLRAVAEKAAKDGHSIIFLPCHRSHVDYVSLQLICYRLGLALPTVVAGDNLNFPLVGPFLQHAGAMWIRRSFGDDSLYITLLQAYIDTLLQKGFNFECFIEGGRSRIGKLLPPKFGILSFLLDSVLSGRVSDAIICPVSTQYDKVIEVNSYISELLGTPKRKENLQDFLSASSILSLKLGRVDVRFHEPWSLRSFIQDQQARLSGLTASQQAGLQKAYNSNLRVRLLRTLGYKVLSDINTASVVMPTSLIGTVLLTLRGRGVGKSELIRRVDWLSDRVRSQGGRVAHFAGLPTQVVVERGLEVLGPELVGSQKGLVEETFFAADRFQLSFYRNMTIHLFISQALICASMYTAIKAGGTTVQSHTISYHDLLNQVSFLSQLFRGEFIFSTAGLETNLKTTLVGLEADGVINIARRTNVSLATTTTSEDANTIMPLESHIESVTLSETERQNGRENFDFYCFLLWPFIEASWLGAVSLLILTPPSVHQPTEPSSQPTTWMDERAFAPAAQLLGKTLYAQGDLSYFEAVNKETLKNASTRFEEEGIITIRKPPKGVSSATTMVKLNEGWVPPRRQDEDGGTIRAAGRLWEFCEEISHSRSEGKNRRDGEAVTRRTLALIERVSGELWGKKGIDVDAEGGERRRVDEEVGEVLPTGGAQQAQQRKDKRRRAPLRTTSKASL